MNFQPSYIMSGIKQTLTLNVGTLADLSARVLVRVSIGVNTVHVVTKLRLNINFRMEREVNVMNVTYLVR